MPSFQAAVEEEPPTPVMCRMPSSRRTDDDRTSSMPLRKTASYCPPLGEPMEAEQHQTAWQDPICQRSAAVQQSHATSLAKQRSATSAMNWSSRTTSKLPDAVSNGQTRTTRQTSLQWEQPEMPAPRAASLTNQASATRAMAGPSRTASGSKRSPQNLSPAASLAAALARLKSRNLSSNIAALQHDRYCLCIILLMPAVLHGYIMHIVKIPFRS